MAPDQALRPGWMRRWAWPFTIGMLVALLVVTVTLTVLMLIQRNQVNQLRAAGRTAEVATCYAAARGRPGLIVILRVIAGLAGEADRLIINGVVDQYEGATPTEQECDVLALERDLNPADFPAPEVPRVNGNS